MTNVSRKILLLASLLCAATALYGAHGENVPSAAPTSGITFTNNLSLGNQGSAVFALQQFLIANGFLKVSTSTGYFGSLTKTALSAWQTSVGIAPASGFFGPLSREKINAVSQPAPMSTAGIPSVVATTTVTVGTTSPSVASGEIGLPTHLIIPTLNIDTTFQDTGLKPDGTMEVPNTIYVAGWFTDSVRPGEKGVAIVTGHVAQIRGGVVTKMGVFSNLYEIKVGDQLQIVDDKGQTTNFVVRAVRNYDPNADATDVFTSEDNGAHLNLITCEGTWVQSQLSYTQRLVVFTDLVASSSNHAVQ